MKSQNIPLILIEPDSGLQELTRLVALRAGFHSVQGVGRGDLAQTLLRTSPAAVVVTELCLPRLDGLRLLEGLEVEGHTMRHRVVVLSASPRLQGLEPRLKALGVKAVLAKPFETAALVEVLTMLREAAELEAEL